MNLEINAETVALTDVLTRGDPVWVSGRHNFFRQSDFGPGHSQDTIVFCSICFVMYLQSRDKSVIAEESPIDAFVMTAWWQCKHDLHSINKRDKTMLPLNFVTLQ